MGTSLFLTLLIFGTAASLFVAYWLRGLLFMAIILTLVAWVRKAMHEEEA